MIDIIASLAVIFGGKVVYENSEEDSASSIASVCFMAGAFHVLATIVLGAIFRVIFEKFGRDIPDNSFAKILGQTTLVTGSFVAAVGIAEVLELPD